MIKAPRKFDSNEVKIKKGKEISGFKRRSEGERAVLESLKRKSTAKGIENALGCFNDWGASRVRLLQENRNWREKEDKVDFLFEKYKNIDAVDMLKLASNAERILLLVDFVYEIKNRKDGTELEPGSKLTYLRQIQTFVNQRNPENPMKLASDDFYLGELCGDKRG